LAHEVFISHSSKDKAIADAICANLEAAGVRCWIAPRDIAPGEDWPTAITRGISQSSVMVLVFSAHSNSSEDVSRELFLAANSKLVIIPFKIENVEPEPGKQYYLARTHWLDAINPPTQAQIQELVNRVKTLVPLMEPAFMENQTVSGPPLGTTVNVDQVKQPTSRLSPPSTTKPVSNKGRISWWFWSIPIGVILLGILGWAAFSLFFKHPASPIQPTPFPIITPSLTAIPTPTKKPTPKAGAADTAQATPTTSVGSVILFQDNFDSNANGWELGKYSNPSGDLDRQIIDGKFRLTLISKQDYFYVLSSVPNFTAKDFLFSIDATIFDTSATLGDLVLGFTLREAYNGGRYEFDFYNDNSYAINLWPSADPKSIKYILTGDMGTAKLEKGITNTFAIQANGPTFTFYINGNKIDTLTDTTINEAGSMTLWLGLIKTNQSVTMEFDNLTIQNIP
jgi:hypothetical protein